MTKGRVNMSTDYGQKNDMKRFKIDLQEQIGVLRSSELDSRTLLSEEYKKNANLNLEVQKLNVEIELLKNHIDALENENIRIANKLTIGQVNQEDCSGCGRRETWHPDCPVCAEIEDLRAEVIRYRKQKDDK